MAKRVLDFSLANPSTDASYGALVQRLQQLVQGVETISIQQRDGNSTEQGALTHRQQLRDTIAGQLRHLILVARQVTEDNPELGKKFKYPNPSGPNRLFITAAKSMLSAAQPAKEELIKAGLGENFLETLQASITAFELATETAHAGRRDHVDASSALKGLASEAMLLRGLLDGFNRTRFAKEPIKRDGWLSARNLVDPVITPTEEAPAPVDPAPNPVVTTTVPETPAGTA